ncbi:MAG: class II glutamine amidotransferase [Planctomycetes bacterium]|nr:class II glutamine amidotransferase [Planctomycetota bacterium]
MCRHLAVIARRPYPAAGLLLDDPNALRVQSICDRHGDCHSDGWGLGYYVADRVGPLVIRRPADARLDQSFAARARELVAPTWIAHVRNSSVGSVSEANCHPFRHGAWLFSHNGTVTNFDVIGPRLAAIVPDELLALRGGTTDSELIFVHVLARLQRLGIDLTQPVGDAGPLVDALVETLRDLDRWSREFPPNEKTKFNFLLTDGVVLASSRWNHDLHWRQEPEVTVVASEATGIGAWQEVPEHSILGIDRAGQARLVRL